MILQKRIEEAKALLAATDGYTTRRDRAALQEQIELARKALTGEAPPYSRCREFLRPEQRDPAAFALRHFVMTPTYLPGDAPYTTYGLADAVQWFAGRDMRRGTDIFAAQWDTVLAEFLNGPGAHCTKPQRERLRRADAQVQGTAGDQKARVLATAFDTLDEVRCAQPLRSDTDPQCLGLFDRGELHTLWQNAKKNPLLRHTVQKIREVAAEYSLEHLQAAYARCFAPDDYTTLNRTLCPWSESGTVVTFRAPAGTAAAVLRLLLPSCENEKDGLGHIWLDALRLVGAQGNTPLPGGGFEEGDAVPAGWRTVVQSGRPRCLVERRPGYCGKGTGSLYLCNPTARDAGGVETTAPFALAPGRYTLLFDAKMDGKLHRGLHIELVFLGEEGQTLGRYETDFARKTWPEVGDYNLRMQCCALLYLDSGERVWAEKAKICLLHFLDTFCQGAEHWLCENTRPEGSDAYGAVQGGRNLCAVAFTYGLIREAGVFTCAQTARFLALVDFMLHYMLDRRDRAALPCRLAQKNCSNWQTDMCIGAAMIASVLPELPDRRLWWNSAYTVLRGQLEANLNPDGSWPESIRYHHAALEHFALYALLLWRETGENWFAAPALRKMFGYSLHLQTPPTPYFGGCVGTPPFGDHALSGGNDFALYGLFLTTVKAVDPALADRMAATWQRAGCKLPKLWGESVVGLLLLAPDPATLRVPPLQLASCADFPDAGITVFRHGFGTAEENYLAVMSSPRKIGHGHRDQGSFVYYYHGVPLVMDTGIEGYFDASTPWHLCSMSHACLQFHCPPVAPAGEEGFINLSAGTYSAEHGLQDVPVSSKVLAVKLGGEKEELLLEIAQPGGPGLHRRHFVFWPESGVCEIHDTVAGYDGLVTVSLPLAAQRVELAENGAFCRGFYGKCLRIEFDAAPLSLAAEKGRSTRFFPTAEELPMTTHLRAVVNAAAGLTTRLIPFEEA